MPDGWVRFLHVSAKENIRLLRGIPWRLFFPILSRKGVMNLSNQCTPLISFVAAKSGSGKTTLLEKVIKILKKDGMKIAVIKHDAHQFDIDKPGKDSWRMAQAGADIIAISSSQQVAIIEKVDEEKKLDEIIGMISGVDLILTEGFKGSDKPKIEVCRSGVQRELFFTSKELLAVASDVTWDIGVPCYHIDDAEGIAREVKKYIAFYHNVNTPMTII